MLAEHSPFIVEEDILGNVELAESEAAVPHHCRVLPDHQQRDHHHRGQAPGPHHRDPSYALKCLLASDVCYRVMAPILQTTVSLYQNTIIHFHPKFEPGRILMFALKLFYTFHR